MAKSSKKSKEATAQDGRSTAPGVESSYDPAAAAPAKPGRPKKGATKPTGRAKSVETNRTATPRKRATGRKTRAKTGLPPTTASGAVTDEEIQVRAYLISEWRTQNGVGGDSAHDWLEARRQLQEESGQRGGSVSPLMP